MTTETRSKTEALLRANPSMGATGSSDAHELHVVGCYFTEFDDPIVTIADFVTALLNRRGRPRHRVGAHLASGPVGLKDEG